MALKRSKGPTLGVQQKQNLNQLHIVATKFCWADIDIIIVVKVVADYISRRGGPKSNRFGLND